MPIKVPSEDGLEEMKLREEGRKKKEEQQQSDYELRVKKLLPEAKKRIAETLSLPANLGHALSETEIRRKIFNNEEWTIAIGAALQYFEYNPNNPEKIKRVTVLGSADAFYHKKYTNSELPQPKPKLTPEPIPEPPKSFIKKIPWWWILLLIIVILLLRSFPPMP